MKKFILFLITTICIITSCIVEPINYCHCCGRYANYTYRCTRCGYYYCYDCYWHCVHDNYPYYCTRSISNDSIINDTLIIDTINKSQN